MASLSATGWKSMTDHTCAAILLAAGASTRLGRPKQLLRFQGESLLRRTARMALEAGCSPLVVVLGSQPTAMLPELAEHGTVTVTNTEWQEGMASSIRAGLKTVMHSAANALLLVCDQPGLSADFLRTLRQTHESCGAAVAASHYDGVDGVPAIFAASLFPALLALRGDEGARRVIAACQDLVTVEFPAGALDIDTPEDAAALDG